MLFITIGPITLQAAKAHAAYMSRMHAVLRSPLCKQQKTITLRSVLVLDRGNKAKHTKDPSLQTKTARSVRPVQSTCTSSLTPPAYSPLKTITRNKRAHEKHTATRLAQLGPGVRESSKARRNEQNRQAPVIIVIVVVVVGHTTHQSVFEARAIENQLPSPRPRPRQRQTLPPTPLVWKSFPT